MKFDRSVFGLLLALNVFAAACGLPYQMSFAEQGYGGETLLRMPFVLALLTVVIGQLFVAAPAAAVGVAAGPGLGLRTPLLTTLFRREREDRSLGPAHVAREAALWGIGAGALLAVTGLFPTLDVERELVRLGLRIPEHPPVWAGVLASFSAGIGEETIFRFGLFTAVAWLVARVARAGRPADDAWAPPPVAFHVANVVAALAFASLHFLNVSAFGFPFTPLVVFSVLLGNGVVGLLCGWLYWRRGIEAAMIAHTTVDLVIHALVPALVGERTP